MERKLRHEFRVSKLVFDQNVLAVFAGQNDIAHLKAVAAGCDIYRGVIQFAGTNVINTPAAAAVCGEAVEFFVFPLCVKPPDGILGCPLQVPAIDLHDGLVSLLDVVEKYMPRGTYAGIVFNRTKVDFCGF